MIARLFLTAAAMLLVGCGYVGDPLPPALHIPTRVADLKVIQTGDRLRISFTAPAQTTEQLEIRRYQGVDLRIGTPPSPFSWDAWAATAQPVPVADPEPGEMVNAEVAAARWAGHELLAAVRIRGSSGRYSAWSNPVTMTALPPLPRPVVAGAPDPGGIRLTWQPVPGTRFRILRKAQNDTQPVEIAMADQAEFVDPNVSLGKTYTYTVQASRGAVESLPSEAVSVMVTDTFPPAPPKGLVAIAGVNTVELAWDRNTEADFGTYRVYRAQANGPYTVLADAVEGVAYADRQVQSGQRYSYRLTAIDKSGNESGPSASVSVSIQ